MEQKKAVWTVHKSAMGLYRVQSSLHAFEILGETSANDLCSRLNATEGLDMEALPELIILAQDAAGALEEGREYIELPKRIYECLDRLTGGKK